MKYKKKVLAGIYRRVVGAMSGLKGIKVELHEQVTPHYDPDKSTIFMPPKISFATNEEDAFTFGRGITVHEASHVLFAPDLRKEIHKVPKDEWEDFREWINVFADINNEYKVTEIWEHLKEPLHDKTVAILKAHPEKLETDNPFIQVLLRIHPFGDLKAKFPKDYNPDLKKFVEATVSSFQKQEVHRIKARALVKYTHNVFEEWAKVKDQHERDKQASDELQGLMRDLGAAIKAGNDPARKAIQKKIDKLNLGKGWFKEGPDRRLLRKNKDVSGGDYNNIDIEDIKKMLREKAKDEAKIGLKKGGWGTQKMPKTKDIPLRQPAEDESPFNYPFDIDEAYTEGKQINRKLRKKVALQEDFATRQRSGIVDFNEVRRQVNSAGRLTSSQVFERKPQYNKGGEWAISVLIDCSGSMGAGSKMSNAKQALATLAYALDGLPYVHYELRGFTTGGMHGPEEIKIKNFEQRKMNIESIKKLAAEAGNCDGFHILASVKRLRRFKNMKKLMVVISDGQPAYENGLEHTAEAVKIAERYGIKVLGIGIEGCHLATLESCYPFNYFFHNSSELDEELTKLILDALKNKRKKIPLIPSKF